MYTMKVRVVAHQKQEGSLSLLDCRSFGLFTDCQQLGHDCPNNLLPLDLMGTGGYSGNSTVKRTKENPVGCLLS